MTRDEYVNVHKRLRTARGKASAYTCVGCPADADEWSWTHDTDPLDFSNYSPRCRSCHRLYDGVKKKAGWGARLSAAGNAKTAELMAADPVFREEWRRKTQQAGLNNPMMTRRYRCSCGLESHLLGVNNHQRSKGHQGMEAI